MNVRTTALNPKDYAETPEGLVFAIVSARPDGDRIPAYLRYLRKGFGLEKVSSREAPDVLKAHGTRFVYDSETRQTRMQGLLAEDIARVYSALERTAEILESTPEDPILAAAQRLLRFFKDESGDLAGVGVTGSLLLNAQKRGSDIDVVVYDRKGFHRLRDLVQKGIRTGVLSDLTAKDWLEAHDRRGPELTLEDYVRHERRKGNKALVEGIKFDLTLIDPEQVEPEPAIAKQGAIDLRARILDATEAFGFPARYRLDHPDIEELLAFSQTYAGQAEAGEWVLIRGRLEGLEGGRQRMVVGSDREARGEFIKRDP